MNNDKCRCECKTLKEHYVCKKGCICNPAANSCKNGKYLASIIDNSVLKCDETIETRKTAPTKSTLTFFYILLAFLLITKALLIAVSIYCYQIKL